MEALQGSDLDIKSSRDALSTRGFLDTGNYGLNWAISGRFLRGYPLGHTCEIFGDPGTGKSFLITRALSMVQEQGGVAMLDDTEGAYNLEWIDTLGVNPDHLGYKRSRTVKDHLAVAQAFIKAYADLKLEVPGVLSCDSLALLSTTHELEVGLDKRDMTKAAELKGFFRIVGGELFEIPAVYLCANHTIAQIGGYGQSRTTPGGGGPKFQASVRLDLRAISKIKSEGQFTGVICRIIVAKNRIVAPWKEASLAIPFYKPLSRYSGLIPILLQLNLLGVHGQFLTFEGEKIPIKVYKAKDNFLRQDESAEELLESFPDLLKRCDAVLALRDKSGDPWSGATLSDVPSDE